MVLVLTRLIKSRGTTNHRPFSMPSTKEARRAYAKCHFSMIRFMLFTISSEATAQPFASSLSQNQRMHAMEMLNALLSWKSDQKCHAKLVRVFSAIHSLSWSLFTSTYDSDTRDRFKDPVIQFLLSYILQTNGQVLPPEDITPIIAKVQFVMRLTYFNQCHQEAAATGISMME
jgi:hypothetical protein